MATDAPVSKAKQLFTDWKKLKKRVNIAVVRVVAKAALTAKVKASVIVEAVLIKVVSKVTF